MQPSSKDIPIRIQNYDQSSKILGSVIAGKNQDKLLISMTGKQQLVIDGSYYIKLIHGSIFCLGYEFAVLERIPVFSRYHRALIPVTCYPPQSEFSSDADMPSGGAVVTKAILNNLIDTFSLSDIQLGSLKLEEVCEL